jgi:acyl-CoA synthetase (AMP-forming)/AMP-acid ligase II
VDVGQIVTRAGRRWPGRVAVEGPEGSRTFAELANRVTRLANALRAPAPAGLGLRAGDRVLDLQTNSVSYLETDLAIRSAGLVRVALNYRLHPSDWQRIAEDCSAAALVLDARFAEQTTGLREALGPGRVVVVGGDELPGHRYEPLLAAASERTLPPLDPDALCGLHYSSGTTGAPKGAQRTHRNWMASLVNMTTDVIDRLPTEDDVYLHAGPITHTSGLFVLPFLARGARQIVLPSWDPEAFVDAVANRGATHTAVVPTMVARLLALGEEPLEPVRRNLRMLGYAGAPMPPEQIRLAHERVTRNLVQYYGLVEAIPPVTVLDAEDHQLGLSEDPDLLTSAGRPALGVEVEVVDEAGRPLPTGEIGEVVTRGDHVMRGYYAAESRTDLGKAVVGGWLHTGDLGRLDAAGRLWLVDRKGDMIISGGYNIYPREVEDVVAEVPGVHEVAVVGVNDPDWGQRVVALYTVHAGAQVAEDAVLEHCRARMAAYKKPKQALCVAEFPTNSTGKIFKKVLRERLEAGDLAAGERV